jgi:hypothetical protein
MSERDDILRLKPHFGLDAAQDVYVLSLTEDDAQAPVAEVRLSRRLVERAVLDAAQLRLEFRTNGSIAAFTAASDLETTAITPLVDLIREAVALIGPDELAEELASLEEHLAEALAVVHDLRSRPS